MKNLLIFKEYLQFVYDAANNEIDKAISNYLKAIAVNDKFLLAYNKI